MVVERVEIFYSGRVQGVGFRWTTLRQAQGLSLSGWVENLSDGRVRVVAEGSLSDLRTFMSRVDAEMASNIEAKEVENLSFEGLVGDFCIRK